MIVLDVHEARNRISQLLDAVAAGEEVIILRHGQPAARLVGAEPTSAQAEPGTVRFPDRSKLRDELPPMQEPAAETVRGLRDETRC